MSSPTVWLHQFGGASVPPIRNVVELLANEELTADVTPRERRSGPAVVLFDEVSQALYDFVHELSRGGFERVLALAARDAVLVRDWSWRLLQAGASDAFAWDAVPNPASMIAACVKRWIAVDEIVDSPLVRETLVGRSPSLLAVLREVVEVARWTQSSILITGESGTGKELVARLIHSLSPHSPDGKLVVLDCATVVAELSGSEFFGHERGAFTGAIAARDGAFALADGGTLFLEEVGELPLRLQAELLRVTQERTYKRVGGNTWKHTSFRLVCATNRSLREQVARGLFRADFYHRLASWTCRLPSLQERRNDIPALVDHFLRQIVEDRELPAIHPAVRQYLLARDYPGNVRELQQLATRIARRYVGSGLITVGMIPEEDRSARRVVEEGSPNLPFVSAVRCALAQGNGLDEIRNAAVETAYSIVLEDEGNNTSRTARRLKITKRAVQMHLKNGRDATD